MDSIEACPAWAWTASSAIPASRSRVRQVCRSSWQVACASPARRRAPSRISSSPRTDSGCPRRGPLSTTNTRSVSGAGRPLGVQVGGDRGEEPRRDRDQPLVAALALGDEHPPLGDPQVLQPQPEDLAAAQPAEHHRRDHRPVPVRAQRRRSARRPRPGCRIRGSVRGVRDQRHPLAAAVAAPAGSAAPAAPGSRSTSPRACRNANNPETTRQPPAHRAAPTPRPARRRPAGLHPAAVAAAGALRGDEPQHVRRPDLAWRLADHGEEHLQVVGRRQHRVRPTPPRQELQIVIQQRHPRAGPTGSPPGPPERIKHGLTVGMQVPFSPRGPPGYPRRNVHEDHPHIKHVRAFAAVPDGRAGVRSCVAHGDRSRRPRCRGPHSSPSAGTADAARPGSPERLRAASVAEPRWRVVVVLAVQLPRGRVGLAGAQAVEVGLAAGPRRSYRSSVGSRQGVSPVKPPAS